MQVGIPGTASLFVSLAHCLQKPAAVKIVLEDDAPSECKSLHTTEPLAQTLLVLLERLTEMAHRVIV